MTCVLCHKVIQKAYERFLVDGKAKFDVRAAISKLPFTVEVNLIYICKSCLDKLKKLEKLKHQERELLTTLEKLVNPAKGDSDETVIPQTQESPCVSAAKRQRVEPRPFVADISPVAQAKSVCSPSFGFGQRSVSRRTLDFTQSGISSQPVHSTPKKVQPTSSTSATRSDPSSTVVTAKLQWPSGTRERQLPSDLQSLGKMLVRGTYKQIADAAWKNVELRKQFHILALKSVDKEFSGICSTKQPSCLRSPNKDKLLNFSFDKVVEELENRAPFTYSVLRAACVNKRNAEIRSEWVPTMGMAAAILLRNRSSRLNAV